jgi:threonine synthase
MERGTLDYYFDLERLREEWQRPESIRRGIAEWLPLLPIQDVSSLPPLSVGPTPFIESERLARHIGIHRLYLKLDSFLPSCSLKDRATAVALAQAREWNSSVIAAASTGNAASSLAALSASTGQYAILFVPADAPLAKLAQITVHGAVLVRLNASYDDVFEIAMKLTRDNGWYIRSTAVNPILAEGKKTAALEIAVQLEYDTCSPWFVSVGDGCIYGSLYKGLHELQTLGWIPGLPRLVGVQAEGASPVARAWTTGNPQIEPMTTLDTYADSIAVGHPRDWVKALRAAEQTSGSVMAVPDSLIRDAGMLLSRYAGVLAEPAAAASFAGLLAARESGEIGSDDDAVILITGHGLKDQHALVESIMLPEPLEPDSELIMARVKGLIEKKNRIH